MEKAGIDISVLMLFFNRADNFGRVFEQVRKARPARLFLYQDGPRNEADMKGIMECRAIVEHIDWECEVHRLYQEKNFGCDPSEYLSQKWAFSFTDKCIVLEDDDVPSQSFFPFCKEMLDRYEHDNRIWMVTGFNTDEKTPDVDADYFFTSAFSIWGWATWRRVIDTWEGDYAFMDDPTTVLQLTNLVRDRNYRSDFVQTCRNHKASGKEYYETIFWASLLLNNGLAIMPRVNLINNIGLEGGVHFDNQLDTVPRGFRRIFTMGRHELEFPLRHPKYVVEHTAYIDRYYRAHAWNHPWIKFGRMFEELFLNLRKGNFRHIVKSIKRRMLKVLGMEKY